MLGKRIFIVSGHYGSGKTNVAVNLALNLKKSRASVAIADIDIVNPYFRTKDSEAMLRQNGIGLICSPYANSNVDIPALPQEIYSVTDELDKTFVLDVGGDERGALALGRIAPKILEENNFEMLFVINKFRPLTSDCNSTIEVMREIEYACGIKFTAIVNNSNLGAETTAEDVLGSLDYANEVSDKAGLPVIFTAAADNIATELAGRVTDVFPMAIQKNTLKECL